MRNTLKIKQSLQTLIYGILLISPLIMAAFPATTTAASSPVIVVLGDSLSAAHGINPKDGWVTLMQQRLKKEGLPHKVINESISGDTTDNGLYRLPEIIKREKIAYLVLALGANDGLRGMPFPQMKSNLKQIMDMANSQKAKIVLVGITLPTNYGSFYKMQFEQVYNDLAKEYDVPLLPNLLESVPTEEEYFQADRLHPNEAAQPIIMENVWGKLRKIL